MPDGEESTLADKGSRPSNKTKKLLADKKSAALKSAIKAAKRNPTVWQDPAEILNPLQTYRADDLLVWKHPQRGVRQGIFPHDTCFPNPVLHDDLVIATTFSPGHVCAVSKQTGERRWMRRLPYYAHKPIFASGYLFCGDSRSIVSLSPRSGKKRWKFMPYAERGEWIYSLPVFSSDFVFSGDRDGMFTCLNAQSGKVIWSVETSEVQNASVNATALAFEDLIITATNAKLVLAYEQATGKEVWRQSLPDISSDQIQWYEGMALVRTHQALYGLSPQTGEIQQQWSWEGLEIQSVAVAESLLCVAVTNDVRVIDREMPAHPCSELLGIRHNSVQWRLPYPQYSGIALRWDDATHLLYEAMYRGLGIVDVETGRRLALIQGFAQKHDMDHVGLPSTDSRHLYILTKDGAIWALRHPVSSEKRSRPS